jgi:hypothetical protein
MMIVMVIMTLMKMVILTSRSTSARGTITGAP